jgi:hypothetical protein
LSLSAELAQFLECSLIKLFDQRMKKFTYFLIFLVVIAVSLVGTAIWHWTQIDSLTSEEAPLNMLSMPFSSVQGNVWMDGGSVWVGVVDSKGMSVDLTFPYDYATQGYPQAFHGAKKPNAKGAILFMNSDRARFIALRWLYLARGRDEGVDDAFVYLSRKKDSIFVRFKDDCLRRIYELIE